MELTVRENIIIYGRYFGLPRSDLGRRADELIDFVQLNERADSRVEPLSVDEEAPDDRTLARERSRGDAAGRAHDRARPAGTAHRLGPALPAEAARRHADSHDSLHGRGRAAVRPARRHGQGQDRRRGLASGAHPPLLHARGGGAPFPRENRPEEVAAGLSSRLDGFVRRLEALPDRLLLYTDDGDATASHVHELGLQPDSVLVRRSTLEDVFLHLTGRTLVDE